jgi:hypothetical protein
LLLQTISIYSPLLPILVFLILKFNKKKRLKWVVFILLILSVLVDILSFLLAQKSMSNLIVINVFTLVEGILLTYFFYFLFFTIKVLQKLTLALCLVFVITWVFLNVVSKKILTYDYISQAIEFIILLFLCLLYFFQKTQVSDSQFIYNTYEFWLVSAFLIYCAGTFFSFFTPMNPSETNSDIVVFEYISRIGSIIKSILITIAFYLNLVNVPKNQPNPNSIYYIKDLKE